MLWPILKKDLSLSKLYLIITPFLLAILHFGDAGNIGVYSYILLFASYYPFYTDFHNEMNRFMVSLPISRKQIILSRYLAILILMFFTIALHFLIDYTLSLIFLEARPFSFQPLVLLFTLSFIIILVSIILPVYYYARSFLRGFSINFYLLMLGMIISFGLVNSVDPSKLLNSLSLNPYLLLITLSALCLAISYRLSVFIFSRKDL